MAPAVSGTVDGKEYIHALATYVRQHETKLADFVRRKPTTTAPSWTTILTLGIVAGDVPVERKPPLVLRFDPHHLYFLLLKFDEAGIPGIGSLDVRIDGGPSRPMSVNYGSGGAPFTAGGRMLGMPDSDSMSFRSGFSSFSMGSGWWGTSPSALDETLDVKYLYSSCTKLPALHLSPFTFSTLIPSRSSSSTLSKPVHDFEDCPPPETAVPLYAFKNLQSLVLEDLDPRAFLGWDALSMHLRSLEVHQSGIEDLGELICDAVVEDLERGKKGSGRVGEERRRRQGTFTGSDSEHTHQHAPPASMSVDAAEERQQENEVTPPSTEVSSYAVPPSYAWSQLRHLSLSNNSLTFLPSPPLAFLPVLTSLDLSSNLLVAVPPGLAQLHSLRSLNLSDNMIDTLVGVHKLLGAVSVINLSKNRLEGLSGLDRLFALERVDVRENRIREALEVSRLAQLPCLTGVWVEGNPFAGPVAEGGEDGYRVKCFGYFAKEHKAHVTLDGTLPGMSERRALEADVGRYNGHGRHANASANGRGTGSEEARTSSEAKVVGRRVVTASEPSRHRDRGSSPSPPPSPLPPVASTSKADVTGVSTAAEGSKSSPSVVRPKHRSRKPHRIVDLDALPAPSSSSGGPRTADLQSDLSNQSDASDRSSSGREISSKAVDRSAVEQSLTTTTTISTPTPTRRVQGTSSLGPSSSSPLSTAAAGGKKKLTRRDRLTASTFEPPTTTTMTGLTDGADSSGGSGPESSGAAFRKKIEALRNEVGESWLSVLSERELAAERKAHATRVSLSAAAAATAAEEEEKDKRKDNSSDVTRGPRDDGGVPADLAVSQEPIDETEVTPVVPEPAAQVKVVKKNKKRKGKGGKK